MIASGDDSTLTLSIVGRDVGASAVARGVGDQLSAAAKAAAEANQKVADSAVKASQALAGMDTKSRIIAEGGLAKIAVAAGNLEVSRNVLKGMGIDIEVVAEESVKAAAIVEKLGKQQSIAAKEAAAAIEAEVVAAKTLTEALAEEATVAERATPAVEGTAKSVGKIPSQARSAANGLVAMSFALSSANGSMQSAAIAGGLVASSLASMTDNAKLAGAANGIGAVVTVLGLLAAEYEKVSSEQGKVSAGFQQRLGFTNATDLGGHFDPHAFDALIKQANDARDTALKNFDTAGKGKGVGGFFSELFLSSDSREAFAAVNNANAEIAALTAERVKGLVGESKMQDQLAHQRKLALEEGHLAVIDTLRQNAAEEHMVTLKAEQSNQLDLARQADDDALENAKARIAAQFRLRDEYGEIRELTAGEKRDQQALIDAAERLHEVREVEREKATAFAIAAVARQNAVTAAAQAFGGVGDVSAAHAARLAEIKAEADAMYKAGIDQETIDTATELKKRALRRQTQQQTLTDVGTITGALVASGNAQLKAIGHAGDTIRRIVIGAQAAHAAVESAIEFGKGFGALATGSPGAALHFASAAHLAAAAALGAKESLGGGSGAGGGASGGAGSTGADSFTPRNTGGAGGGVTLIVQTVDPTSKAVVANLRYQFGRADTLNVPVPITGGGAVHVLNGAAA